MLKTIVVSEFRNIQNCETQFSDSLNIFLGDNGQGKSNLLEAICLLLKGESFRQIEKGSLVKKSSNAGFIRGRFVRDNKFDEILCAIEQDKKSFLLNSKKINIPKLVSLSPVVVFAPESLNSIKGAPETRRQLLDDFLILKDPSLAKLIAEFKKSLRMRNKVLKDISAEVISKLQGLAILESLGPTYTELAIQVTLARLNALRELKQAYSESTRQVLGEQCQEVSIEYWISDHCANDFSAEIVGKIIKDRMHQLREIELSSGVTLVGPHKHDIRFVYNQNDSRFFCSQGQQRSLILAFKFAQIMYHRRVQKSFPILLLDDVLSELDLERRGALISLIGEMNSQVFLTTTDLSFPSQLNVGLKERMKVIAVKSGEFKEITAEV